MLSLLSFSGVLGFWGEKLSFYYLFMDACFSLVSVWKLGWLVDRAPDSRSKGCEFESWQEWWKNFFSRVNIL